VIIYDQACATEKRRAQKRRAREAGGAAAPTRLFINERVCEGCGDCGAQVPARRACSKAAGDALVSQTDGILIAWYNRTESD
jgi:TPP-dependent indolepyruvate ferredoxin oxidoreductase alpha subunit